jgi:hypothetical protein
MAREFWNLNWITFSLFFKARIYSEAQSWSGPVLFYFTAVVLVPTEAMLDDDAVRYFFFGISFLDFFFQFFFTLQLTCDTDRGLRTGIPRTVSHTHDNTLEASTTTTVLLLPWYIISTDTVTQVQAQLRVTAQYWYYF